MEISKFQFACNCGVNLNFDTQYLGNSILGKIYMDFFCNLFVFWSSFRLYKNWKFNFYPPLALIMITYIIKMNYIVNYQLTYQLGNGRECPDMTCAVCM